MDCENTIARLSLYARTTCSVFQSIRYPVIYAAHARTVVEIATHRLGAAVHAGTVETERQSSVTNEVKSTGAPCWAFRNTKEKDDDDNDTMVKPWDKRGGVGVLLLGGVGHRGAFQRRSSLVVG